ncbi:MAG: hypothetical protein R3E91_03205 [Chlamydiales bacterium]
MLNALPEESPERTDLLKIKMMIEAGYIFKDGDVISKKSTEYSLDQWQKLFISFYNQIDQQYSNLNDPVSRIWHDFSSEARMEYFAERIDERLNTLPEKSPERTDLLKIKMMIEAGYIFKNGGVILRKPMIGPLDLGKKLFTSLFKDNEIEINQHYYYDNDPFVEVSIEWVLEKKMEYFDKKIDEILNTLPNQSPEKIELFKIKMMIKEGYIFKNGDVILKKSIMNDTNKSLVYSKNLFLDFYRIIMIEDPDSHKWDHLNTRAKMVMFTREIDERLERLLDQNPAKKNLYQIIWMIEAGYIFKDGDAILDEPDKAQADAFLKRSNLLALVSDSKQEFLSTQEELYRLENYVVTQNPSSEELEIINPYRDHLNDRSKRTILNENHKVLSYAELNEHHKALSYAEKEALKKEFLSKIKMEKDLKNLSQEIKELSIGLPNSKS